MSEAQLKGALKQLRNMCIPRSGVTQEALCRMSKGDFDDDDKQLKCYLGCIMGMMQAVKGGKISLERVKGQITKRLHPEVGQKVLTTFESCQNVEGADNSELAYNFAKCIYKKDKEAFIVP